MVWNQIISSIKDPHIECILLAYNQKNTCFYKETATYIKKCVNNHRPNINCSCKFLIYQLCYSLLILLLIQDAEEAGVRLYAMVQDISDEEGSEDSEDHEIQLELPDLPAFVSL